MKRRNIVSTSLLWIWLALGVLVVSCGGGGGGGNGTSADTTPPSVVSAIPANNADNVSVSTTVSLHFSERIDCTSVNSASVALTSGNAISGNITCSDSNVTFTPASVLSFNTIYSVTVVPTVTDVAGNAMASTFNSIFTTAAAPPPATYTIGGMISGLSGTVVLQNNGGDNLSVSVNNGFTFATAIGSGAAYNVTVLTQPAGQLCKVSNGVGLVDSANVTDVSISCVFIADVLIALDTSTSMSVEVGLVQNVLNNFANAIMASGIDLNIVVIAASGGICTPAPLGSGTCPSDENLPRYRRVLATIGGLNSYDVILATYAQWSASLRSGSHRTIIVVTDDNSTVSHTTFNTQLLALDPTLAGYRFNSIVATLDPLAYPANICSGIASARGSEFIDLSTQTGGIVSNLCEQNFAPAFSNMASAIITSFP